MKTILMLAHSDDGQEARLRAAVDVTKAVGGHLVCLDVTELPTVGAAAGLRSGYETLVEVAEARELSTRVRVERSLADAGLSWEWRCKAGAVDACLAGAAGLADLIVTSAKAPRLFQPGSHAIAERVLFHALTPMLVVPETSDGFRTGRAVVSWDGSTQCAAALRAAVPLLALADRVELLHVEDGSDGIPLAEADRYLRRYGIDPVLNPVPKTRHGVGATIVEHLHHQRADYIVMGAYSHWRMTEAVFGGTSRHLLETLPVPLFMAH